MTLLTEHFYNNIFAERKFIKCGGCTTLLDHKTVVILERQDGKHAYCTECAKLRAPKFRSAIDLLKTF